ncbi:hypothetical protein NQ176_g10935 [Zarea fungicola]|uniref:Uncharacterized protein n=1 Tax=Zarea fungicola TaxID=93591 RepID=A0ACC1MDE2_9HYPO|nr:hypothetical protein NQ176_g10935 [Lecanicillium fungicola]
MSTGINQPSYVSMHIEHSTHDDAVKMDPGLEDAIKWTATSMYVGGSDTTVAVLSAFVLAMTMFPEVQKTAQKEIDTIIGSNRLPELQDQERLPYVSAVVKEALRWFLVTPMGAPHLTEDDIHYQGYTILKGAIILAATWWFYNDLQEYHNPLAFESERFLAPRNEVDPAETVFGHGRRVCPGKYIADMSPLLTISRILAIFEIRRAVDKSGMPIKTKR